MGLRIRLRSFETPERNIKRHLKAAFRKWVLFQPIGFAERVRGIKLGERIEERGRKTDSHKFGVSCFAVYNIPLKNWKERSTLGR